ncbi:hypothetical protein PLESTB_000824000 [Pleodorina starrii]|uniref:Box C/D snoRNA protein 1 n=1 Tax=Pleodorina starrii TaxID=330485 RepID=A0A9W6F2C9_9CHLO|nr:hypothetical protein PLESTB_000824000 [Pleodorina starrii]
MEVLTAGAPTPAAAPAAAPPARQQTGAAAKPATATPPGADADAADSGDEACEGSAKNMPPPSMCEQCGAAASKYRCPGCQRRSCSLTCVRAHKAESGCSGQRDRTAFVPMQEFDDRALLSDFRLLEEIGRVEDVARRCRPPAPRPELPPYLANLVYQANRRGVKLLTMAPGMAKRKANTTRYDGPSRTLRWRVEWRFPGAGIECVDEHVDEHAIIKDVLSAHLRHPAPNYIPLIRYAKAGLDQLRVFMRREKTPAHQPSFFPIDTSQPLSVMLANRIVIEYPVFIVAMPHEAAAYPPPSAYATHPVAAAAPPPAAAAGPGPDAGAAPNGGAGCHGGASGQQQQGASGAGQALPPPAAAAAATDGGRPMGRSAAGAAAQQLPHPHPQPPPQLAQGLQGHAPAAAPKAAAAAAPAAAGGGGATASGRPCGSAAAAEGPPFKRQRSDGDQRGAVGLSQVQLSGSRTAGPGASSGQSATGLGPGKALAGTAAGAAEVEGAGGTGRAERSAPLPAAAGDENEISLDEEEEGGGAGSDPRVGGGSGEGGNGAGAGAGGGLDSGGAGIGAGGGGGAGAVGVGVGESGQGLGVGRSSGLGLGSAAGARAQAAREEEAGGGGGAGAAPQDDNEIALDEQDEQMDG